MAYCIYSGADERSASFETAEHIFPKCIGGVRCLPRGWVSDAVNNAFSKLELGFARSNPTVALNRMFFAQTGRKKHQNRERIGIFENLDDHSDHVLGYVRNAVPIPICQVVVMADLARKGAQRIPVRIVLPPSCTETWETQIQALWAQLRSYTGSPHCLKDRRLPPHTYLLGYKERRWFLGVSEKENPEEIKPRLQALVAELAAAESGTVLDCTGEIVCTQHPVEVAFSFQCNYLDYLRVYAKIAVNCLAALKGQALLRSCAFDGIKRAILTGEDIEQSVWQAEGPDPVSGTLRAFPERLELGGRCHAAAFLQKEGWVYGVVSLYGMTDPMIVKLGRVPDHVETDFYICDWEHRVDYTMTECVLKICRYDEETPPACGGEAT